MRLRRSRLPVAVAVIALTTACTAATAGHGSVHTTAAQNLVGKLEPLPPGAHYASGDWAQNSTPTVEEFTAELYRPPYAPAQAATLRSQGVTGIAHQFWIASNGDQCDDILLSFRSVVGATSRYVVDTSARRNDPAVRFFAIPGATGAVGSYKPQLDAVGKIRAVTYARSGDVVVEQFGFTTARLRPAELNGWLEAQLRRL